MDRPLLQDRRVWIGGGVVVALIIAAASWFMLISPKMDSTDSLQQQNADAQTANSQVQAKNDKLRREAANLDGLKFDLLKAAAGLPAGSGLADFTREVTAAAAQRRVTLTSIAITPPTAQAAPVAATPTSGDTSATGGMSSPTPAATSAAPVDPTSGTIDVQATLISSGPLTAQDAFLSDLQNGARRLLVTSSQVSVASGSRVNSVDAATTMTTQVTFFSSPATASQLENLKAALVSK